MSSLIFFNSFYDAFAKRKNDSFKEDINSSVTSSFKADLNPSLKTDIAYSFISIFLQASSTS